METVFLLNGQYYRSECISPGMPEIDLLVPAADHGVPHKVRFQAIQLHLPPTTRVIYATELPEDELAELLLPVYVEEGV